MAAILGCNILTIKAYDGTGEDSMDNKVQNLDMQTTERNDTFGDEAPEEFEEEEEEKDEDLKKGNNKVVGDSKNGKVLETDETLEFGDFQEAKNNQEDETVPNKIEVAATENSGADEKVKEEEESTSKKEEEDKE